MLPRNVALRHGAVPVTLAHDVLTVALDDIRLATKVASVRTAVATGSGAKEAVASGMRSMRADGLAKALAGRTTLSATDDHHTRDLATGSGATGFIPKPISEPQLRPRSRPSLAGAPPWSRHRNRRSPASSSSTGWAQVGQYQRASRGVPQVRWRRVPGSGAPERSAPHWASRRRAPARSRPSAVSS